MPPGTSASNSEQLRSDATLARGPRVTIRLKRSSDMADDYAWQCDPELARLNAVPVLDMPIEAFAVAFEHERVFGRGGRESFAIDAAGGVHIGSIMYYGGGFEQAELGITIGHAEGRGRGLGSEATILFLRFLWRERPYRRIVLHTLETNGRALRCFEKAGFGAAGRVIRNGEHLIRMEAQREWWLLWDAEGRFEPHTTERHNGGDALSLHSP